MRKLKWKFIIFFILLATLISSTFFLLDKYYYHNKWKEAINYYYAGQYKNAISKFEKCSNFLKYTSLIKTENAHKYIELQYRLAISYLKIKDFLNAEKSITEGQKYLVRKYGEDSYELNTYNTIGLISYYIAKEDFEQAKELLEKSNTYYQNNKTIGTELISIKRLYGDMYYAQKEYNLALKHYEEAYELTNEHKLFNAEATVKIANKIANIYIKQKTYSDAINIYNDLIKVLEKRKIKNDALLAYIHWKVAKTYKLANLYNEAVPYFLLAINDTTNIKDTEILRHNANDIKKDLAETYSLLNKPEEAKILLEEINNK